jgi:hypothetical protein
MTSPCERSNSAADEYDKANEPSLLANPKVADVGFECSQRHVELEVSSERSIAGNNDMIIKQLNQAIPEKSFLSIRINGLHFRAPVLGRLTTIRRKFLSPISAFTHGVIPEKGRQDASRALGNLR